MASWSERSSRSALFAASLLLIAGCGDSSGDADGGGGGLDGGGGGVDAGGGGGPVPEDEHAGYMARAYCDVQIACECETDSARCLMETQARAERNAELERSMGLTYDASCASELAEWIAIRGCHAFMPREQLFPCALYHGDVPEGSECTPVTTSSSNCARGLMCLPEGSMAFCRDPAEALPDIALAGEPCGGTTSSICDPLSAFCNVDDGICQDYPAAGEACDGSRCRLGAYCDTDTDACLASRGLGEPCVDGTVCETLSCDMGSCSAFCYLPPF